MDHNRRVIYSSDEYQIGSQMDNLLLPDKIFESEAGYVITGSGDNRKMLVYSTPPYNGYDDWTFLSQNDYSSIIGPIESVRDFVYVACFAAIVLSLVLIAALSRVLYKPVRHVLSRVELLEKENSEKLKLERIQFLRKLFVGNVPDDLQVIKDSFAQYQVGAELDDDIRVLLVSVDYINSYYRQIGSEIEAADSRIEKMLEKCCKIHYERYICIRMQNGIWALCVPVREENEKYDKLFKELNQELKCIDVTVSIAVSSVGHSERDIPYLYSEVVDIHSYQYLWGQNRIITDVDIKDQGQSKFEYPNETEKKFLSQLFGGKDEAVEAYEEFVTAIRAYTVEEIKMSFMILAYSVKNTSQKTMAETSSILVEFDRFYKKLQEVETIDEVHHMFYNLIEEITDKQKLYSKERYERLIDQIKSYVESNYGDLSLSVNQVADHVNMSAAYLGRVFKQISGITFTEYLTKFRLDIACSLLKETNLTVNEISDQIGFTNSSYFHIIFKKNLNCTPNQYRKQCKITAQ